MRAATAGLAISMLGGSAVALGGACRDPEPTPEVTFCCAAAGLGGGGAGGDGTGGTGGTGGGGTGGTGGGTGGGGTGGTGGAGGGLGGAGGSGTGGGAASDCGTAAFLDDEALTSPRSRERTVDVWSAPAALGCGRSAVALFVHGGAWRTGDEAAGIGPLASRLAERGVAVASVRYRLSPDPPDLAAGDALRHPAHVEDVTLAIAWLHEHADELGFDPARLIVVGREAGAHLAALSALDEARLGVSGLERDAVRCVAALEPRGLDLVGAIGAPDRVEDEDALNAFGPDPATWQGASPLHYVAPGSRPPAFWIATRATSPERDGTDRFVDALRAAGGDVREVASPGLTGAADTGPGLAEGDELAEALAAFVVECAAD